MIRLNLVGWAALAGAGAALAIPGPVLGRNRALSLISGMAAAFVVVGSRDYWKWRHSWIGIGTPMCGGVPMSDGEAEGVAAQLRSQGLGVVYERPVTESGTGDVVTAGKFRCRAPHARHVGRALGWPDPPPGLGRRLL